MFFTFLAKPLVFRYLLECGGQAADMVAVIAAIAKYKFVFLVIFSTDLTNFAIDILHYPISTPSISLH